MQKDQEYLDSALADINTMLETKQGEWTVDSSVFDNFDIMQEFSGLSPLEFALVMCRLKMQRIKNRLAVNSEVTLASDSSLRDSLQDLAGYAILSLGIMNRERERDMPRVQKSYVCLSSKLPPMIN